MRKLKAITLVESAIYLALFGIMFIAIIQFVITMRDNNRIALEKVDMERVVIFVTNHISENFKNATSIDEANSVFNADSGTLRILRDGRYIQYTLNNGEFSYSDDGTLNTILDPDYKITKFYLEKIYNNNNALLGSRLDLSLESIKNIQNKKTIRTSYILK